MKVYLKSEDIAKENKIPIKNLNFAWIHKDNQEILNELYTQNLIYFDIIGKKDNIEGFEFTNKNYEKIYFDKTSKYFDFLNNICNTFVYVQFKEGFAYFVEYLENEDYLNANNIKCVKIKIKTMYRNQNYILQNNFYNVSLTKKDFENLKFELDMPIPIKRTNSDNTGNIIIDYIRFKNLYFNLEDIYLEDLGIIEKIEVEYHNYFKQNLKTIYYNYKGSSGHKFVILSYCIMDFKICDLKVGDKIYLKLNDKGFRVWDNKKQLQILKESNNYPKTL